MQHIDTVRCFKHMMLYTVLISTHQADVYIVPAWVLGLGSGTCMSTWPLNVAYDSYRHKHVATTRDVGWSMRMLGL